MRRAGAAAERLSLAVGIVEVPELPADAIYLEHRTQKREPGLREKRLIKQELEAADVSSDSCPRL
jgi:hypothetical protein